MKLHRGSARDVPTPSGKDKESSMTVRVDVIYPLLEEWGFCSSCTTVLEQAGIAGTSGLEEYPPEWVEEYRRFSQLLLTLSQRFGRDVQIHVFDPRSLQGLWKSLRFRVRTYPTFIVNGRIKVVGWDVDRLYHILEGATNSAP